MQYIVTVHTNTKIYIYIYNSSTSHDRGQTILTPQIMERNKAAKQIQGGGSGEGFKIPHQVSTTSQEQDEERVKVMRKEIGMALFHEDMFENSDNNDSEIWKGALDLHLSSVRRVKKSERTHSPVNQGASHDINSNQNASTEVQNYEQKACSDEKTVSEIQNSDHVGLSNVPIRQEIPRLPRSSEDAVNLWVNGSTSRGFRPVRLYCNLTNRKLIIKNYSDRRWTSSGQKRAFYRFKRIVTSIANCEEKLEGIEVEKMSLWESAAKKFDEKWNRDGKPLPLSIIEKRLTN